MVAQKQGNNFLFIDINQTAYLTLFVMNKYENEEDMYRDVFDQYGNVKKQIQESAFNNQFKTFFWNTIVGIVSKFPDIKQVIICHDNRSWRTSFFPHYKKNRQIDKIKDNFDWSDFFTRFRKFHTDEIEQYSPFISLNVENTEGDDIIGTLAIKLSQENPKSTIFIYSSDKDFVQLLKYPNIKLYSSIKKRFITSLNPKNDLLALILLGDSSDGIPNVRNRSDHFVNPTIVEGKKVRGERLGEVTVWKCITENTVFEKIVNTPEIQKRFEENRRLIDLEEIPLDIKRRIIQAYEEQLEKHKTKSPANLQRYFVYHSMPHLAQSLYRIIDLF